MIKINVFIIIASFLMFLGISLLFGIEFKKVFKIKFKKEKKKNISAYRKELKKKRRNEILQNKESKITRIVNNIKSVIEFTDTSLKQYIVYSIILALVGFFLGTFLNNIAISFILAILFASMPYFYLISKITKHNKLIKVQLIATLGAINTQFLNEDDFVVAVEKKLPNMPEETRKYFASFVNKVRVLNMNVVDALLELDSKIDNYHFHEYIQLAIQAEQGESGLKYTMQTIPIDMADIDRVQQDFNIGVENYKRDFMFRLITFPVTLLFLRTTYNEYYQFLTHHVIGKIYLIICLIMLIFLSYKFFKLNKDIEMEI